MADVKLLGTGLKLAVLELNGGTGLSRELSRIAYQSNTVTSWVVDRLGGIKCEKCEMAGSLLRLRLQQVKQLNPDPAPGELLTGIEFQFSMLERMIENDMSYDPTSGPERVADEGGALQQEQVKQHRSGWTCFSCGQQASPTWILEQMRKKSE